MNIDYVVSFSVNGNSGKNKATREKASELKKISKTFIFYSLDNINILKNNKFFKFISMILLELYYIFKTLITYKT